MMRLLYILLFLFPSCVKAQTGILGPVVATAYPYTTGKITYTAARTSISSPASLVGATFTTTAIVENRGFLDEDMLEGTGAATSGAQSNAASFDIPFFGAEVPVSSLSGTLSFGFRNGVGDELRVDYNGTTASIIKKVSGSETTLASGGVSPSGAYSLGLSVTLKSVYVWLKQSGEWNTTAVKYYLGGSDFDFTAPATLASFSTVFLSGSGFSTSGMKWGYTQGVGIANQSPITFADGTPFVRDGKAYIYCSIPQAYAGSDEGTSVAHSTGAIVKVDLLNGTMSTYARVCTNRGGVLYGENAGCVMYDEGADQFTFLIPTWGDNVNSWGKIETYRYTTAAFPSGATVLGSGVKVAFPGSGTTTSYYDPDIKKIGSTYRINITATSSLTSWTYYFTRTYTTTDFSSFTLVGADATPATYEGGKILWVGGSMIELASAHSTMRVYNSSRALAGSFSVPSGFTASPPLPSPHPCVIPVQTGGTTEYYWLLFDLTKFGSNNYSWGRMYIAKMSGGQTGHDYPNKYYNAISY